MATRDPHALLDRQLYGTLKPHSSSIKKGISIFSVCMNRNKNLLENIESWLTHPSVDEVVIVDWSSTTPVRETLKEFVDHEKLIIVRVHYQREWILTVSFNLAARFTTRSTILKMDADNLLHRDFFQKHPLSEDTRIFYAGDYKKATVESEKYLNGLLWIHRKHFFMVNGYNENITTYGWDDDDIKNRLSEQGLEEKCIHYDTVSNKQHSDNDRLVHQESVKDIALSIQCNRYYSLQKTWSLQDRMTPFRVYCTNEIGFYVYCTQDPLYYRLQDPSILEMCRRKALQTLLFDRYGIAWNCTSKRSTNYLHSLYNSLKNKRLLVLKVFNGLGNRMRSIASAKAIANATRSTLIVVWPIDEHCEALYEQLFSQESMEYFNVVDTFCLEKSKGLHWIKCYYDSQNYNDHSSLNDSAQNVYIETACVIKNVHSTWKSECEEFSHFTPSLNISTMLNKFLSSLPHKVSTLVGVHIRMGQEGYSFESADTWLPSVKHDLELWRGKSHYSHFEKKMREMLKENPTLCFYLAADNDFIYRHISESFPDNVYFLSRTKYDRSLEQIQTALIDAFVLSKTQYILASGWSSFSEIAVRYSGTKRLIAGKDF